MNITKIGPPLNNIYENPILSTLIKNDVTIYGKFIRSIVFENKSISNYLLDESVINCYTKLVFKDIIERDINKYLIKIHRLSNSTFLSTRCEFVTYILEYNGSKLILDFSYIKSPISYYLVSFKAELVVHLDIDCL